MVTGIQAVGGGLKTVERALTVLEIVATAATPPSIKDVANALGHNISSTYNIVNTLLGAGYLSKDSGGLLRLGTKVAVLNTGFERANDYARLLGPYVEHVNRVSGETVYLTRLVGQRVVIQSVYDGTRSLRVAGLEVGFSGSEDRRASGRVILAQLSDDEVLGILRSLHPDDTARRFQQRAESLRNELAAIRAAGFAFDDQDFEPGICCIAAAYFGPDGTVAGSISASAPSVRADALRGPIADEVRHAARQMSLELGADPLSAPPASAGSSSQPRT